MAHWREFYKKSGFHAVEPMEYIPCPGSIRARDCKSHEEEHDEMCQCNEEESDADLYGFDT
jgi:hypothetical protein